MENGRVQQLLRRASTISGEHSLCWARILTGPSASYDRAGLLAFGLQFAAKIADIDKGAARKLDAANRKAPGKFSYRSLQTTASELERQLAWMQNQRSEAFPALHYPNGVPHFVAYCYAAGVALVVLQAKNPPAKGQRSEGFYATAYGREAPIVLTPRDLAQFLCHRRPQDQVVLLRDLGGVRAVADGPGLLHFDAHLAAVEVAAAELD